MKIVPLNYLYEYIKRIPKSRPILRVLILVNLLGSLYGFSWYKEQLSNTPVRYWLVVPDSPLSVLGFTILLILFYYNRRLKPLEAVVYFTMIKYGMWTMFVFLNAWRVRGVHSFEEVHLFASHFGMAAESILFLREFSPEKTHLFMAAGWGFYNDYMDYLKGFHPLLPLPEALDTVKWFSIFSTIGTYLFMILAAKPQRANS